MLSLVLVVMAAVVAMGSDPCEQYGNGCSTPLHMPIAYKTLFTPSCYHHDVCYRCVGGFVCVCVCVCVCV